MMDWLRTGLYAVLSNMPLCIDCILAFKFQFSISACMYNKMVGGVNVMFLDFGKHGQLILGLCVSKEQRAKAGTYGRWGQM
jgi:hypothetical protein